MKIIRKPAVYRITFKNDLTGGCYIGSTTDPKKRRCDHLHYLRKGNSGCVLLQKAYTRYGEEHFTFEVIAYVNYEALRMLEAFFMQQHKCSYNKAKQPGNVMGGRKHSKSTIRKMRRSHKQRRAA